LTCSLLNGTNSNSQHSNARLDDKGLGRTCHGSGDGLISDTILPFAEGTYANQKELLSGWSVFWLKYKFDTSLMEVSSNIVTSHTV